MERSLCRLARLHAHVGLHPTAAEVSPKIVPSDAIVANQSTVLPILAGEAPLSSEEATARALAVPNRGPLELNSDGTVPCAITEAFEEFGFYVFTGVIKPDELGELQRDMHAAIDGATAARATGAETFCHNGIEITAASFGFTTPLSDNSSPTGRSPSPMREYEPPEGAPDTICRGASYYLRFSEAGVRLYGHPALLALAEAVNGVGFTPFSDSLQVKIARLGPAVA
eukprot:SAG11_NODE_11044_length_787_cov_1.475291_1_plen_227_part_00